MRQLASTTLIRALCCDSAEFRKIQAPEKIDFIFDDRQKEKDEVVRIWKKQVSALLDHAGYFGATPRFENDKEYIPLQAADLLAWWVRQAFDSTKEYIEIKGLNFRFGEDVKRRPTHIYIEMDEDHITKNIINEATSSFPHLIIYDKNFKSEVPF